ncbi:rhodanese-like domain-containing protein [Hymenobacter elongatus]|uniref:Rhodanese-like domain-containing protein n=1 Tax=Hymenobacter elongatus TaxID=877208 RepID=A0A4Z0PT30_9BACT|nr:rhodanese-like domain-containing protein [Hymenobacter elongatus]TGE20151.1 rhodanese-like domain-containing protein [Hymenobacter elongatus]
MKRFASGILWLFTLSACGQDAPAGQSPAYDQLLRTLYRETVPTVQPATLAQELRKSPSTILLLDTRTPAEYGVSHLRGARFVDFDQYEQATFADVPRDRKVVVYCSVGYRSERVGERLQALGFKNVRNLYGGIFQWVNEGRTVYNHHGKTQNVHPYSALWSPWLTRGNKVYQ